MGSISDIQAIRAGTAEPHGDSGTYGGVESVRTKLSNTDPAGVAQAGGAYLSAAGVLDSMIQTLESVAGTMAGDWKDKSSQEAQKALQLLHASARELAYRARQVGAAHNDYAEELRKAKANLPDSGLASWDDDWWGWAADGAATWDSENSRARKQIEDLNKQISIVYQTLPDSVSTVLPNPGPPVVQPPKSPTYPTDPYSGMPYTGKGPGYDSAGMPGSSGSSTFPGGSGFPGSGDPSGTGQGATGNGSGTPPGNGSGGAGGPGSTVPGVADPSKPPGDSGVNGGSASGGLNPNDPRSTDLAGLNTPPNATSLTSPNMNGLTNPSALNTPPGLSGTPTNVTGPSGLGPLGTGPAGTSPFGSGGASYGGPGAAGVGQGLASRANGGSGPMNGMPFMPMGGAGGEGNQERERSTWLTEDESVWGGDGPVAPGVIC
jgi:hypothetical protein